MKVSSFSVFFASIFVYTYLLNNALYARYRFEMTSNDKNKCRYSKVVRFHIAFSQALFDEQKTAERTQDVINEPDRIFGQCLKSHELCNYD